MAKWDANLRLIPAVLIACTLLLGLKVLFWSSGSFIDPIEMQKLKRFTNQSNPEDNRGFSRVFEFARSAFSPDDNLTTGSVEKKEESKEKPKDDYDVLLDKSNNISTDRPVENIVQSKNAQSSEVALLERLQQRRLELEEKEKLLEEQKTILEAAQKKLEEQVEEFKKSQANVQVSQGENAKKDDDRLKSLVVMYETMRARDAAKIFDKLDLRILSELSKKMKPQKLGDILALMQTENAEKLTRELAKNSAEVAPAKTLDNLPKIQGKPAS